MQQFTEKLTEKQRKQRLFLFILPLVVVPFLTILFWSLGLVGTGEARAASAKGGLNMQLPDARPKENKSWNKLSFYEQADKDSARYREAMKSDPFYGQKTDSSTFVAGNKDLSSPVYNPLPPGYEDLNEKKVNQKLAELNATLSKKPEDEKPAINKSASSIKTESNSSGEVDRLEHLLQAMNEPDAGQDSQTQQLNGMMDKILDIQHPERINERLQQQSEQNKRMVYPVTTKGAGNNNTSLLQAANSILKQGAQKAKMSTMQNGFYSLESDTAGEEKGNSMEALIEETQTVVSGSMVKLSLQTDVYINGILIPAGTFVFGIASQSGERLMIAISSVLYQNHLLPVSLSVYDLDGLPGIYVPGSLNREVAKQSGSEAVSSLGITTLDPSIGAQAASAGIQAAKTLLNKKVKQIKVTLPAGYRMLLKDNNGKR